MEAYKMALVELKKRNRIVVSKFDEVPSELKSLMYFFNPSKTDYDAMRDFLNKKYRG
jgi:hypothetical protein